MRRTMRVMLVALCLGLVALPARAGELAGVVMPDAADVSGARLMLNGMALRKVVFIKVYVGGLYLPRPMADAGEVLAADGPRRMVLHFLRGVDAEDMSEAWMEGLEDNTPDAGPEVRAAFATLCAWMRDVAEGEEMTATYTPTGGTEISLGGEVLGTLAGKPFADALYACWIGPDPGPGKAFRKALLGG